MSEFAGKQALLSGLRYQRSWQDGNRFDRFMLRSREWLNRAASRALGKNWRILRAIRRRSAALERASEAELEAAIGKIRARLRVEKISTATVIEAFAVIRETSARALGMRHHDTQVLAALTLLRGGIAEMATGEGKTLAATLAAATAAFAGIPVHIVTVNDYLAERDAGEMEPLYRALGLSVGTMREMVSLSAVDGSAMIALPPLEREAPRTKSTCPPMPL